MKQIQLELFPEQDRKGMYHKSDATPEKDGAHSPFNCADGAPEPKGPEEKSLGSTFPGILAGDGFLGHASQKLETWDRFFAMAIRIEPDERERAETKLRENETAPAHGVTGDTMNVVAEMLDQLCDRVSGFWGIVAEDCLGCFVPEMDASETLEAAQKLREDIASKTAFCASAGISGYPLLDYSKEDILGNALKALEHASFLGPDSMVEFDAVSLNISGDKLYQNGDIDGAVKEFQTALLMDSENVNVRNSLGVCYGVRGEHARALEEFDIAMRLDPEDVMAPYNAGLTHLMTGDEDKALEFFLRAYMLDENQFEVSLRLGRLYLNRDDCEAALRYLEKAVELKKESAAAHRFTGECRAKMGMVEEAIRSYSDAIKANGNDAYSLSALGGLFADQGRNMEIAMVFCEQSVELAPESGPFRYRLGSLYFKDGQFSKALEQFERAAELGSDCEEIIAETKERISDSLSSSQGTESPENVKYSGETAT